MNPSKLSQQDYDRYCIIVEDILKDIPIVCDECAYRILYSFYYDKFMKRASKTLKELDYIKQIIYTHIKKLNEVGMILSPPKSIK